MADAKAIIAGLGGAGNIIELEPCITRLRADVHDPSKVDRTVLRAAGAHGVMATGTVVQVVVGPEPDMIVSEVSLGRAGPDGGERPGRRSGRFD